MTTEPIYFHSVEFVTPGSGFPSDAYGAARREEVIARIPGTWRKTPAIVEIVASRERLHRPEGHLLAIHDRMGGWHVWTREARADVDGHGLGATLSDVARERLGAEHTQTLEDYLTSPAFTISRSRTLYDAVRMVLRASTVHPAIYRDQPSQDARRALAHNESEMNADDVRRLTQAADALDKFASLVM